VTYVNEPFQEPPTPDPRPAAAVGLSHGLACACSHEAEWHHVERGCQYLGNGAGRCGCRLDCNSVVRALTQAAVTAALTEAAEAIAMSTSYGAELRHDGSEDPGMAAYVEGLRDACDIVRDRIPTPP